tara:strand:- start:31 stop:819 length:789 start_codon:yes stop_codon:yes gene_type:complete
MIYKLGILGKDIAYSLSPYIHKSFGKEVNIDLTYDVFDINSNPIDFVKGFFEQGGTGLNITKPFKEVVAEKYSSFNISVNTLSLESKTEANEGFIIKGSSTDGGGFLEDLISRGININNKNVLLLGLGGAGHAIANSLSEICSLHVWNRSKNKYILSNGSYDSKIFDGNKSNYDFVVSCVSALDKKYLELISNINFSPEAYLIDINYKNISNESLYSIAQRKKIKFLNGQGMLVEQAALSFKEWFGVAPSKKIKSKIKNERL